jgi:hypothetical protein
VVGFYPARRARAVTGEKVGEIGGTKIRTELFSMVTHKNFTQEIYGKD